MLNVYYFTTTGWGGTGDLTAPVEQNTLWGTALVRRGLTLDQCYNACNPTEDDPALIAPDPDSSSFRDANGFRLHTVIVPLGASLSLSKQITLAGGAYRLRLDGGGIYKMEHKKGLGAFSFYDVDFVRFTELDPGSYYGTRNFYRCEFIDCDTLWTWTMSGDAYDCLVYGTGAPLTVGSVNWHRSTVDHNKLVTSDSISTASMTEDDLAANFVDAANGDFRLLSTSEYATGNALTSADGVVYDLEGNKRKPGGAKGAYEVLSDLTHETLAGEQYDRSYTIVERADDAPVITKVQPSQTTTSTCRFFFDALTNGGVVLQKLSDGEWRGATVREYTPISVQTWDSDGSFRLAFADENGGAPTSGWTYVDVFPDLNSGQTPFRRFDDTFTWRKASGLNSLPTLSSSSVCLIGTNTAFADTGATVKEIIVPGWTHVDVGDVTAKIKLGLGATVRSSGKLTLENETTTSADLLRRVQLRAPALLTLKDCDVSD